MNLVDKVKNFSVYFALPSYDSKVDIHFLMSMLATQRMLDKYGIRNGMGISQGDCYIQRARNELTADFLKNDYTHIFFIDSDMGWDPEKVLSLLALDLPFVCGAYQIKNDQVPKKYVIDPLPLKGGMHFENNLIKLRGAPSGFMCVKRTVFEQMIDAYGLEYERDGKKEYNFFSCGVRSGQWFGEDIDFSHKWLALKGEIWCEPDIDFTHSGYKSYECNFNNELRRRNDIPKVSV